jgi:nucleotide-binding universal stress UspA family protein
MIYGSLLWDQERVIRSARAALKKWQDEVGFESVKSVKRVVRVGVPYVEIVDAAIETKCDLLVIPTHGRTGLKHYLLGGTAERVVRHATCPVLVVRAE